MSTIVYNPIQKKYEAPEPTRRKSHRLIPTKSFAIYLLLFILLFITYMNLSYHLAENYHTSLLKTDDYWNDLKEFKRYNKLDLNGPQCMTAKRLNSEDLADLQRLIWFFNNQPESINYFLCFSSLYFTTKFEEYGTFREVWNSTRFQRTNDYYRMANGAKCIESDYDCKRFGKFWNSIDDVFTTKIHLCLLNDNKSNICSLLTSDFNKQLPKSSAKRLQCRYNVWNGEYEFQFGHNIKLVIHEFESTLKTSAQLSFWRLQTGAHSSKESNLNDEAKLNLGLMDYFVSHDYFSVPLFYFYSQESRQKLNFEFINYMGSAIRLPSEPIDYFMKFYPNIWFITN